jgi:gamma-glutamyltranspeptidase
MAPTIVLTEAGDLVAALGAPSSNRIPSIITNVISNLVDRRMGLAEAVETPRVLAAGPAKSTAAIEVSGAITAAQVDLLEAMGCDGIDRMDYPPTSRKIVVFGGINAVGWDAGAMTFVGVGDGRRWGSAQGPATVSVGAPGR